MQVHSHDLALTPRARRVLAGVVVALAAGVLGAMVLIGFGTDVTNQAPDLFAGEVYEARVVEVDEGPCAGTTAEQEIDCALVDVRLAQGPDAGESRTLSFALDSPTTPDLGRGDRIVLSYTEDADEGFEYTYADRQRRPVLLGAAVLFAAAVVLLGRWRGLAALAGLAVSIVVILVFVLPAILEGHSPVLVAVLGAAAIAYVALYLAHGVNALTTVALVGTLAALFVTVLLSAAFTELAEFSGFVSEEAVLIGQVAREVDISGLVLGGIVIGALGALDDVTVTQASAVAELRGANPSMSRRALTRAGIRIGRDHIASTVNTLTLAYAGAALPVLLLFVLSEQSLGTIANSEVIAVEIVRTLVGSIGLVTAVPITTMLAARVVSGPRSRGTSAKSREPAPPAGSSAGRDDSGEESFWR